jgi:glutathione synthase/RimK-type ligase-like ATP-grasp enzyme
MAGYETTQARILHRLCEQVAAAHGYEMQSLCEGWVIRLSKEHIKKHIYAHNFELNSAAARNIASDKAAAAALLAADGVPCIEHVIFRHPEVRTYVDPDGNWPRMRTLAEQWGWNVVVKPMESSGGHNVLHVTSPRRLEAAAQRLFTTERALCLCPFYEASREHRVVVLDGEVELMYSKSQPFVVGDGERTLVDLVRAAYEEHVDARTLLTLLTEDEGARRHDWRRVPPPGERVLLGWKHNLRLAGRVEMDERADVAALALRAAAAINLRFGAVDILDCADGLRVLELNSGFMTTHFVKAVPDGEAIARRIYEKAILRMMGEG